MKKTNIVIIGAGFAGVYATKKLSKYFKGNKDISITLIDKHSYFTYLTELHEVAAERVPEDAIQYDLKRLFFNQKNVHLITDNIKSIDYNSKTVIGANGNYPYNYVILGIGSEPNDFGTPGVKEYGYTLGSWEQAIQLKNHIRSVIQQGSITHDKEKRAALLSIAVVGSGFTGTETIGEICDWKDVLAKEYKINPEEIKLTLIEMAPTIMNMLDRKDAEKAERYMKGRGVRIMKSTGVVGVREDDLEKALQIQLKINDLISELTSFKGNLYDVMKLILAKRGVSVGRARNPLPHAEDDEMDHVEVVRQHIDDAIAEFTK